MTAPTQERTRSRTGFHPLTVSRVDPLTDDSVAITFAVPDDLAEVFAFDAGQSLTVRRVVGGVEHRRSYSICAPAGRAPRIGVREVPGGAVSAWLVREVRPGDVVEVGPPTGSFRARPGPGRHVCIAAGSGITPMLSIASTVLTHPEASVALLYGNRTTGSVMFAEDLADLKDQHADRLDLVHVLSREPREVAPGVLERRLVLPGLLVGFGRVVQREPTRLARGASPRSGKRRGAQPDERRRLRRGVLRVARLAREHHLLLHGDAVLGTRRERGEPVPAPEPPRPRVERLHRLELLVAVAVEPELGRAAPQVRAPRRHRHLPPPPTQLLHLLDQPGVGDVRAGDRQAHRVPRVGAGGERVPVRKRLRVRRRLLATTRHLGTGAPHARARVHRDGVIQLQRRGLDAALARGRDRGVVRDEI